MYQNFEELKDAHPKLTKELLREVDEGEWEDKNLYYFETLSDLAQYEIEEGLYEPLRLCEWYWGDAPNLLDFIDLNKLGEAWSNDWDENYYHRLSDDSAIFTNCGWEMRRLCQKHLKILKSLKKSIQRKQNNYCMM